MLENTKPELDSRLEVAFSYLKRFCEQNNKILTRKFVKMRGKKKPPFFHNKKYPQSFVYLIC